MDAPKTWQEWAAAVSLVQAVVVVTGIIFAGRQLLEANRARRLNATKALLDEIGNAAVRLARHVVLSPTFPNDVSQLTAEQTDQVRALAVAYDRVAYLTRQNLLPSKPLFDFQRDEIPLVWQKVRPLVKQIRESSGASRLHYCQHLEWLATRWHAGMMGSKGE